MALERKAQIKTSRIEVDYSDIEWIKQTLTFVNSKIQDLDLNFTKLNQTVIGDKTYGQTGLIEKIDEHNAYIEKDKEFKSRLVGGGLVVSFIWGLVLKFWKI
jgi:aminopeptidase-like protein